MILQQAEYTVFGQAWPFLHSPHFVDLLSSPKLLNPVQCMSLVYLATGHPDNVTPMKVVETYRLATSLVMRSF